MEITRSTVFALSYVVLGFLVVYSESFIAWNLGDQNEDVNLTSVVWCRCSGCTCTSMCFGKTMGYGYYLFQILL